MSPQDPKPYDACPACGASLTIYENHSQFSLSGEDMGSEGFMLWCSDCDEWGEDRAPSCVSWPRVDATIERAFPKTPKPQDPASPLAALQARIRAFSDECEESEFTETDEAWELLNEVLELGEATQCPNCCAGCGRDSLTCSKNPCPDVVADREETQ